MSSDAQLPPAYWNMLSQDDKNEYMRLRQSFHHGQKISSKDRRIVTFRKELNAVLHFLERSEENKEARCVLTGVCFAGKVVCVNTRQLKSFLSRCKSSINGSFQQLGYVALRTKAKAKNCVITALPSLQNQQHILRQWTCRVVSEEAQFCFVSSFRHVQLPEILEEDLFDEKKPVINQPPGRYYSAPLAQQAPSRPVVGYGFQLQPMPPPPQNFKTKMIDDDLQEYGDTFDPSLPIGDMGGLGSLTHSLSASMDDMWSDHQMTSAFSEPFDLSLKKSPSFEPAMTRGWDASDMLDSPLMPYTQSLETFDAFGSFL